MTGRLAPDERRAALLDAAGEVFFSTNYADAAVADVAALCGVSEALVFRYFPTKAELHTAVVRGWAADLATRQDAAVAALAPGAPVRDTVRALLEVLLDDAAGGARWWVDPGSFPPSSLAEVGIARRARSARLRELLAQHWPRHDYALEAWPGFVEAAVRTWASRGCPRDERGHVLETSLGALQGALGDWGG